MALLLVNDHEDARKCCKTQANVVGCLCPDSTVNETNGQVAGSLADAAHDSIGVDVAREVLEKESEHEVVEAGSDPAEHHDRQVPSNAGYLEVVLGCCFVLDGFCDGRTIACANAWVAGAIP